jgi:hypothetical protein
MADSAPSGKTLLERLQVIVSIVLAATAGYSAWQMNATEKSLKETERSLKTRESERRDSEETRANRESIEKKQLLVYDAVVKSLESGDPKKQSVSKALVTALLEDPLRTELLVVLTTSAAPEIKKEAQATIAQESAFKADERVVRAEPREKPANWADWDFDLFWCERSGSAAQAQAEKIKKQLEAEGAKGRIRVRLLPDSINDRAGYQHAGYVIRYNAGEEAQSNQLKALGDSVLGPAGTFVASLSYQATPWYLSAFLCPLRPAG